MNHRRADEPGIAEQLVGLCHLARGQCGPDRPGSDRPTVVLEARHDVDLKPAHRALRHQIIGRARPVQAEVEVVADRDTGDREPLGEDPRHEIVCGKSRQGRVEVQHDGPAQAGRGQQAAASHARR